MTLFPTRFEPRRCFKLLLSWPYQVCNLLRTVARAAPRRAAVHGKLRVLHVRVARLHDDFGFRLLIMTSEMKVTMTVTSSTNRTAGIVIAYDQSGNSVCTKWPSSTNGCTRTGRPNGDGQVNQAQAGTERCAARPARLCSHDYDDP